MKPKKWVKLTLYISFIIAIGITTYLFLATEEKELTKKERPPKQAVEIKKDPEPEPPKPKEPPSLITPRNFDKIKVGEGAKAKGGTKLEDVIKLLGEPTGTAQKETSAGTDIKIYEWTDKRASISITFVDNLVFDKTMIEIEKGGV
jgi:hypothetical protein